MADFRMPLLGADMEAGTLVKWLKQPGDSLTRGDIIAVVDTAKGAIDIEVFEDGILESIRVKPGEQVPVGTVLAMIRGADIEQALPALPGPPAPPALSATPALPAPPALPGPPALPAHVRASPAARKIAADLGVDLAHVAGTGPQGVITREDVEHAGAARQTAAPPAPPARPAPPAPPAADRALAMRTAIAAAMTRSKRDIPHYYLSTTIEMTAALAWLRGTNELRSMEDRLLPIVLLIKSAALALHDVPELNGYWVDGAARMASGIHVGCAISLRGGGLIAPALHDADRKDLVTLMREMRDLVARARAGALRSSELSDPTITVTNLGDQGVDAALGIIYPPQVAIVGFGRVAERPWVAEGRVLPRPLLTATLAADHRASDGHRGGVFLTAIDRWLQTPEKL